MANEIMADQSEQRTMSRARRLGDGEPLLQSGADTSAPLDGSRIAQFFRRNRMIFAGFLIAALALMIILKLLLPPSYMSMATVLIDQRKAELIKDQDGIVSQLPADDTTIVDTEVGVLSSSQMAQEVAQKARMVPQGDPAQWTPAQAKDASETIKRLSKNVKVEREGLTHLIDITIKSGDPETAQFMANLYAKTYIDDQIAYRADANRKAIAHLQTVIEGLQNEVDSADAALAQYKASHGLSGLSSPSLAMNGLDNGNTGGTLTQQEISVYNQNLALARAQAANDQQMLGAAQSQLGKGVDHLGVINSPQLAQLRAQQELASSNAAALASKYGPNHPDLIAAQKQLRDINAQIAQESTRYIAGLQASAAASNGRAAALAGKLASTQGEQGRADQAMVRLHELESKVVAPQVQLAAYRARLADIATSSGIERADARIVTPAPLPVDPVFPTWSLAIALGIILGLLGAIATIVIRSIFSVGVSSPEEVEGLFGVEFLTALPQLPGMEDIAIAEEVVNAPRSHYAEAIRTLAAGIFVGSDNAAKVVAITSPHAGEGKTTTTIALGRSLAMRGRRVLIVDCDLQRPSFDQRFGIGTGNAGLVEVLSGTLPLAQAIVADGKTPALFLPLGNVVEPGLTLDHGAFAALLQTLRGEFDVVLLDLPPVLQVAESRLIALEADGTVLLARWKQTSRQSIEYTISMLMRAGSAVFGIALTQVPESSDLFLAGYGSYGAQQGSGGKRLLS